LLAILVVFGGVLTFEVAGFALSAISTTFRYLIYTVPLVVALVAFLTRPLTKSATELREEKLFLHTGNAPRYLEARRRQRIMLSRVLGLAAILLVLPGTFTTYHEMFYNSLDGDRSGELALIFHPHSKEARVARDVGRQWAGIGKMVTLLDSLHAANGQIMVDDADGCAPQIILRSKHPRQFSIPNDTHFVEKMGAPYADGVRYLLVTDPSDKYGGGLDSLDREWPSLYLTGAGLGHLVNESKIPACATYRLYHLYPVTP
jgi:hypothetical protein